MQIVYNGPHPEVVVDEWNDGAQVIVAGQPVDIPDDLAARLLEQSTWALVETTSQKNARLKAKADAAAAAAQEQADAEAEAKANADAAAAEAIQSGRTVEVPDPTPQAESAGPTDTTTESSS